MQDVRDFVAAASGWCCVFPVLLAGAISLLGGIVIWSTKGPDSIFNEEAAVVGKGLGAFGAVVLACLAFVLWWNKG